VKDGLGAKYIAQLLESPGRQIHVEDLYGAVRTQASKKTDAKTLKDAELEHEEVLRQRERAERNGDLAELERVNKKIRQLAEYVKQNTALGGRIAFDDDVDNTRRKVTQAIDRTLKQLGSKERLPKAARHLDNAIDRGSVMCYNHHEDLKWSL